MMLAGAIVDVVERGESRVRNTLLEDGALVAHVFEGLSLEF